MKHFIAISLLLLSWGSLVAQSLGEQDAPKAAADSIPATFRPDRYEATWDKNPFLIKVGKPPQPGVSFAEDWELKYLSERNGVIKAGIQNRKTQEVRQVTADTDAEGFRLDKATISRQRKASLAEISKGAETATFKYGDQPAPNPSAPINPPAGVIKRRVLKPAPAAK